MRVMLARHRYAAGDPITFGDDFVDCEPLPQGDQTLEDRDDVLPVDLSSMVGGDRGIERSGARSIPLRNKLKLPPDDLLLPFMARALSQEDSRV